MSIALVFPGQGSQAVGMMTSLATQFPQVTECFAQASSALGFDLWRLVSEGPAERLNTTEFTQPAMLVAGIATWRVWTAQGGPAPSCVAGHSLGEYSAMVCAQALDFEDAVRLVRLRGQLMQQAVPEGHGAMAAVLGLDDEVVEQACVDAAQGEVVQAVNYNSPSQVVIAGNVRAVERAVALAKERGAKRAVLLPVSVPAHSSLLQASAEVFAQHLKDVRIAKPVYRYFSGVDAAEHSDPADIRAVVSRQLASPVRWSALVRQLRPQVSALIECGPGKVLTGLNRRIDRTAACHALEDPGSIAAALSEVGHA